MKDKSTQDSSASIDRDEALKQMHDFLERNGLGDTRADELSYYCWHETFGSTSGPFGGIGGQAITSFRMEAWEFMGLAMIFSGGRLIRFGEFQMGVNWSGKNTTMASNRISAGQGYEFCSEVAADQWYDFKACRWKDMSMAGYFHPSCRLYRRPGATTS